ncbi:MAG: sigma 54-interacting transcriptional regulator [Spirochaetia bacterium]|nr:sigma 54-interacting transcriptional regulator [Spirochaetia bacterium]
MPSVQIISQNNNLKKLFKEELKSGYEVFSSGTIKDGIRNIKKMDIDLLLVDIQPVHLRSLKWMDSLFRDKNTETGEICVILMIETEYLNKPDMQTLIHIRKNFHIFWYNNFLLEQQNNFIKTLDFFMQNKMKDLQILRQNQIYFHQLNILAANKQAKNFSSSNEEILTEYHPPAFLCSTESTHVFHEKLENATEWPIALLRGSEGAEHDKIAAHMHRLGCYGDPFIKADFAAIPKFFHEAMLFGSRQKNLPGLRYINNSLPEMAKKGTLYIKNMEYLKWELQNDLIHALKNQHFLREDQRIKIKCKIVFSTFADLEKLVDKNLFRQDLFSHMAMFSIAIPSIQQRKKDLPLIMDNYATWYQTKYHRSVDISPEVKLEIMKKNFPGQFDQFFNYLFQLFSLAENKITLSLVSLVDADPDVSVKILKNKNTPKVISKSTIKSFIREQSDPTLFLFDQEKSPTAMNYSLIDIEREYIKYILNHNYNNIAESARILGITRKTLYQKLKKYSILSSEKNTG